MENRSTLTEARREQILARLDLIRIINFTVITMLVSIIVSLAWGNWKGLILTIGVILPNRGGWIPFRGLGRLP